jgi:hypothetical protein
MVAPNGWNFSDWVNTPQVWEAGIPANTDFVPSAILNLHFALTLLAKADMERSLGELQLAERDYATAMNLTQAVMRDFWDSGRGLIADDLKHEHFSEHAQCLAILGGLVEPDRLRKIGDSLRSAQDLSKATIYFSHYLFEAYRSLGEEDLLFERLNLWFQLSEQGFKTTFERVEPSRSDCHAWGAHPLFHCYATILGIRPDSPGFKRVRINPMPGRLREVSGILPHPQGSIVVHLERGEGNSLAAHVELPANLSGTLIWRGQERPLRGGATDLEFK